MQTRIAQLCGISAFGLLLQCGGKSENVTILDTGFGGDLPATGGVVRRPSATSSVTTGGRSSTTSTRSSGGAVTATSKTGYSASSSTTGGVVITLGTWINTGGTTMSSSASSPGGTGNGTTAWSSGGTLVVSSAPVTGGKSATFGVTGGNPATGGSSSSNSVATSGKPATGAGGTATAGATMLHATGGTTVAPAPDCTSDLNLLSTDLGADGNWIGGNPTSSSDNPCGVQGLIYMMGDAGVDGILGNADDTCPFLDQSISPCQRGRCCVTGRTRTWRQSDAGVREFDNTVWGCGLGISLNDPQKGQGTLAYGGVAKGFKFRLSGTVNGQTIRISYTQVAETGTSPFRDYSDLGDHAVRFNEVECPTWEPSCIRAGTTPYAMQVWVNGGDVAGDFMLCVDGIYPIVE